MCGVAGFGWVSGRLRERTWVATTATRVSRLSTLTTPPACTAVGRFKASPMPMRTSREASSRKAGSQNHVVQLSLTRSTAGRMIGAWPRIIPIVNPRKTEWTTAS